MIHPGFNTQGRCHQKSKTGVWVATQKALSPPKIKKKSWGNTDNGPFHPYHARPDLMRKEEGVGTPGQGIPFPSPSIPGPGIAREEG